MRFFEEITAIPKQERLIDSTVYLLAKRELLARALPVKFPEASTKVSNGSPSSSRGCRL